MPVRCGQVSLDQRDRVALLVAEVAVQPLPGRDQPDLEGRPCIAVPLGVRQCGAAGQLPKSLTAGGEQRVDLGVLGLHGVQGRAALRVAGGVHPPQQQRPDLLVLAGVVLVQDRAEELKPGSESSPCRPVLDRSHACRGNEIPQVAAKRVVHDVHRRHVDRPVGRGGLTGQQDLVGLGRDWGQGSHGGSSVLGWIGWCRAPSVRPRTGARLKTL